MNDWFDECLKYHPACIKSQSVRDLEGLPMPTRIIHISVDDQSLKLLEDFNDRAQCITVSYPWGGMIDFVTTNESLNDIFGGFQITALPRTLQDAVFACHQLGVHYLWIDCLCIIQDSPEDKV